MFKFIEPIIKPIILVVGRKFSIVEGKKDDTKKTICEAIGMATYSNSLPTLLTYTVLFDALWNQTKFCEQLQIRDKSQKYFIHTVAHDLRTQLILVKGLTKHVIDNLEDEEKRGLINIVLYDSKRFHSMSENTLALTRMEGNVLMLSERIFDLGKLIRETVIDFKTRLNKIYLVSNPHNRKIKFEIERLEEQYLVKGDGYIISQALSNLIDN